MNSLLGYLWSNCFFFRQVFLLISHKAGKAKWIEKRSVLSNQHLLGVDWTQRPCQGILLWLILFKGPLQGFLLLICPIRLQRPCFGFLVRFTVVGLPFSNACRIASSVALFVLFFVILLLTTFSAHSRDFVSYWLVVTCNYVIISTSILLRALFYSKVVNNWRRSLTETFFINIFFFYVRSCPPSHFS